MRNCGGYSLTAMICQKASLNNSQPGRSFGTLVDIAGGTARHLKCHQCHRSKETVDFNC